MRLYADLAPWWHALSPPDDAAPLLQILRAAGPIGSLLELGSGGGHTAAQLPDDVEVVLTDLSEDMLAVSRALNPGREHVRGDMRALRLGRTFDAVLLHDAVMYLTSEADLRATFETAAAHLRPGGHLLVRPDVLRETWEEGIDAGGGTLPDGRAAQLLEWQWDPDPTDDTIRVDFSVLLRDEAGAVTSVHDHHVLGVFPAATYVRALRAAGLTPVEIDPYLLPNAPAFLARR